MSSRVDDAGPKPFVGQMTLNPVVDPEDASCATFEFTNEDHTLGNSLRYILMKDPVVAFCGYSIPHPSENKMNVRLQTSGERADITFRRGLDNILAVCAHVKETFEAKVQAFEDGPQTSDAMEQ